MTTRQVSLEVNGKMILDADVSKAEQKVKQFADTIGNRAPVPGAGTGGGDPRHAPPAPTLGQYGYNAQRATDSAEGRLNQARTPGQFRDVSDQLERALGNATIAGNKALVERITRLSDELGRLQGAMEKGREEERANKDANRDAAAAEREGRNRDAAAAREARLQAEEAARQGRRDARLGGGSGSGDPHGGGPAPAGGGGILNHIGGWLQQQGQSGVLGGLAGRLGGPLGSLLGGLGGKLLGGPIGMAVGGLSAANYAFNAISNGITEDNAPARNEIMGNADLARQYGSKANLEFKFRDTSGWTNRRFSNLGYSATQAAHVAAVYDRPGGMMNDTESILKFSRTMGVDETRTAAAARTMGLAGIGGKDGGNVGEGLRTMKLAMSEGIKMGIASSDTMNSLLGIAQKAASEGRSMGTGGLAYYAALGNNMNKTGDVALKGASGMNFAQGMLEGFGQQGGDPGMEMMLIQGMGKLPDAKTLGIKGGAAKAFDQMRKQSPVAAARYMLSQLKKGDNPAMVDKISQTIDAGAGDNVVLKQAMYKKISPGASDEQIMDAIGNGGLSKLMHVDGKTLNTFKNGAGSGSDVQGGNKIANSTMYLRVAESDREMVGSLSKLSLFGGMEETMSSFKSSVAGFKGAVMQMLGGSLNTGGDMSGNVGGSGRFLLGGAKPDLSPIPAPHAVNPATLADVRAKTSNLKGETANQTNLMDSIYSAEGGSQARVTYGLTGDHDAGNFKGDPKNEGAARTFLFDKVKRWEAEFKKTKGRSATDKKGQYTAEFMQWFGAKYSPAASNPDWMPNVTSMMAAGGWKPSDTSGGNAGTTAPTDDFKTPWNNSVIDSISGGKGASVTQGFGANAAWQDASGNWFHKDLRTGQTAKGKGPYGPGGHDGVDMAVAGGEGAPVHTPYGGKFYRTKGFQGNEVTIVGKSGYTLKFSHLTDKAVAGLKNGQTVSSETTIGYQGHTGQYVSGTHLHFAVLDPSGKSVAPSALLKGWENAEQSGNPKGKFRAGGYTGAMARHDVAGEVHGQEFVMNADATARYRSVLEGMNSGAAGAAMGGGMTLTLSGTVQVNVALSGAAQGAIQQEFKSFQTKAGRIAAGDIQNKRGIR